MPLFAFNFTKNDFGMCRWLFLSVGKFYYTICNKEMIKEGGYPSRELDSRLKHVIKS